MGTCRYVVQLSIKNGKCGASGFIIATWLVSFLDSTAFYSYQNLIGLKKYYKEVYYSSKFTHIIQLKVRSA